ncbi:lipase 3-like [Leguminivora glycinivorella]|uniref:lipase 3-like n=1 Tax=Leguminivora glycinivorella TaxID=1035111 RepID=UPI00200D97AD|nr:lipase 3-like [Leguminivora glycinivorella]
MATLLFIFLLTFAFSSSQSGSQRSELKLQRVARAGSNATAEDSAGSFPAPNRATGFVDFVNLFTNVPISIVRSISSSGGGINGLPVTFNDNNLGALGENFVTNIKYRSRHEDCELRCDQLITKYGFPVETYEVVTEDGYILKMFRIPSDGPPVLAQHGLIGSSDDYVVAGSESGIAYLLARDGYDVWLANSRGCKHSRRHIKIKPSQGIFWDFSWHEVGYYDLPAMIDYILNVTGREKLKFIGHSQGTTAFFVMGSERPEYMDKIALAVAMSPVAFNAHMRSPFIRLLAPSSGLLYAASRAFGIHEVGPDNELVRLARWLTCGTGPLAELFCSNVMFLVAGYNVEQLNITNLPMIFCHMPSGASAKQLVHYAQEIISKKFRQFDYGAEENMKRYGSSEPPEYDLGKVTAPVSLVYSDADWLVHPRDVAKTRSLLPNVVDSHKVPSKNFNHMDFIIAKDVKYLIYKRLSKILSRY